MLINQWIGNCYVDASGLWQPNKWMNDGKWWFRYGDGSYPKGKFEVLDGSTYYFNNEGYMVTGWKSIKNDWYYFNNDGEMQKGWQTIGKYKYYFNDNGVMNIGWRKIDNIW